MQIDGRPIGEPDLVGLGLTNYGHFTTVALHRGGIRGWNKHLERLAKDSRAVFSRELDPELIRRLTRQLAQAEPAQSLLRITVFAADSTLAQPQGTHQRVLMSTRPAPALAAPARLRSVHYQRDFPQIKHLALFAALHQRAQAQQAGYDDAVFLTTAGELSEGPTWNIGVIRGDCLYWPSAPALAGVTQQLVTQAADQLDIRVSRRRLPLAEIRPQDGVFMTSAGFGLRSVVSIDAMNFGGGGSLFAALSQEYQRLAPQPI